MINDIALAKAVTSAGLIGLAFLFLRKANECETFWEWRKRKKSTVLTGGKP